MRQNCKGRMDQMCGEIGFRRYRKSEIFIHIFILDESRTKSIIKAMRRKAF